MTTSGPGLLALISNLKQRTGACAVYFKDCAWQSDYVSLDETILRRMIFAAPDPEVQVVALQSLGAIDSEAFPHLRRKLTEK